MTNASLTLSYIRTPLFLGLTGQQIARTARTNVIIFEHLHYLVTTSDKSPCSNTHHFSCQLQLKTCARLQQRSIIISRIQQTLRSSIIAVEGELIFRSYRARQFGVGAFFCFHVVELPYPAVEYSVEAAEIRIWSGCKRARDRRLNCCLRVFPSVHVPDSGSSSGSSLEQNLRRQ